MKRKNIHTLNGEEQKNKMTNKKQTNKKPEVSFTNCETYGDNIKALVSYYTNSQIGTFVLEKAIEEIKENDDKIKELQRSLTK